MNEHLTQKTMGALLALLAHDLRNPLSALHSNLGFLQSLSANDEPDAREALEDGLISCDGLSHIIDNLDLFGQVLRGLEQAYGDRLEMARVVRDVVLRSQSAAKSHGVSVELGELAPAAAIFANQDFAYRAVSNLIRNAIQHSGPGSVVRLSCRTEANSVIVRVEDEGPPLPDRVRTEAFTAEGQVAAKGMNNGRYSRGLGLYCAALAATACGGSVTALSLDGRNAFELRLPLAGS